VPVDILGWSMGGMIAQTSAIRHPDLVRRLALIATCRPAAGAARPRSWFSAAGFAGNRAARFNRPIRQVGQRRSGACNDEAAR
jgi:pimeloyl-ACP methyl ester carboxylesterase